MLGGNKKEHFAACKMYEQIKMCNYEISIFTTNSVHASRTWPSYTHHCNRNSMGQSNEHLTGCHLSALKCPHNEHWNDFKLSRHKTCMIYASPSRKPNIWLGRTFRAFKCTLVSTVGVNMGVRDRRYSWAPWSIMHAQCVLSETMLSGRALRHQSLCSWSANHILLWTLNLRSL